MKTKNHDVIASYALHAARLLCLGALITAGQAASIWDGGGTDGNWSTSANWNLDTAPVSGSTTDIQMAGTTRLNSTVDSPFTLRTLVFSSGAGAFNLSGNTITIAGTGADANGVENQSASLVTINNNFALTGATQFKATSGDLILNGGINLGGVSAVNFKAAAGKTLTLSGVVSGNVTTTVGFNSGGTIRINGANTYTAAATSIFNATVIVGVDTSATSGAFGAGTSAIQMGSSGASTTPTLLTGGQYTVSRNIQIVNGTNPTNATIGGSSAAISTFSGNITNGSASAAAQALTLSSTTGGRVNVTGNIVRATGASGTGDNLTKTGAGIVALAGTSSHLGTTAVNQGTLLVTGTLSSGGGAVSVANGAALGGNGTINRAVVVDGILTPGEMDALGVSQAGTLTLGSGLTLSSLSTVKFDLGTARDLIAITGDFTLDGTLDLNALTGFAAGSYTLFTYTGTLTDNGLDWGTLPSGFTYSLDTSSTGVVSLTVVPEPNAVWLLSGALLFWVMWKTKSRTKVA